MHSMAITIACLVMLQAAPSRADDLAGLDWLAGHWVSEDGAAEEVWLAPSGGSMSGSFRWVLPDGRTVLEYLVIEASDENLWLRFKHYGTDFVPWEKDGPNTYVLHSLTPGKVEFRQVADSETAPPRYRYQREGDSLTFTSANDAGEESLRIEFRLRGDGGAR